MPTIINMIGIVALCSGLSSYLLKSHKPMLFVSSGATILWALYFFLKGAHTAAAMVFLASGRIALGAFSVHWSENLRRGVTGAMVALVGYLAYLTWDGPNSLPSTLASLFLTIATLNLKYRGLRYALLVGELLWLWNGIAVGSLLGVTASLLGLAINGVIMLRESKFSARRPVAPCASVAS